MKTSKELLEDIVILDTIGKQLAVFVAKGEIDRKVFDDIGDLILLKCKQVREIENKQL